MIHKSLRFKYFKPNLSQESSKTMCSLCVALKLNGPPHWLINKLITSHNCKGFTCYQIETIIGTSLERRRRRIRIKIYHIIHESGFGTICRHSISIYSVTIYNMYT